MTRTKPQFGQAMNEHQHHSLAESIKNHEATHGNKFDISCRACIELNEKRKQAELEDRYEAAKAQMPEQVQAPPLERAQRVYKVRDVPKQHRSKSTEHVPSVPSTTSKVQPAVRVMGKTMSWLRYQSSGDLRKLTKAEIIVNENEAIAVIVPYAIFEAMAKRIAGGKEN